MVPLVNKYVTYLTVGIYRKMRRELKCALGSLTAELHETLNNPPPLAPGIVGRGVLIDIPRFRGVRWLEPGESVTKEEIEALEEAQGLKLAEGDIMVFRTGHHRRRLELGAWDVGYTGEGRAGLDLYSLALLHERKVAVFLPDDDGETVPSLVEGIMYPIHPLQVTAMGMCVADSLQLEELVQVCEEEGR